MLTIEHDWRMRKLIRANLEAVGVEVQEAVSGQHGIDLFCEGRSDLILLDLDLLELDALHLLSALQACSGEKPVVAIVMSAEPPERLLKHHRHVVGHLLKPFAVPTLLEQVQKALAG